MTHGSKIGKGTAKARGGKAVWIRYKCKCGIQLKITERSVKQQKNGVRDIHLHTMMRVV